MITKKYLCLLLNYENSSLKFFDMIRINKIKYLVNFQYNTKIHP